MRTKEPWHLDKRVPIALIVTIVIQTLTFGITAVWWAAETDGRITRVEEIISSRTLVNERLARMEERFEAIKEDVSDVKQSQLNVERMVRYLARQAYPTEGER